MRWATSRSGAKPFCDGTHARERFDGSEMAEVVSFPLDYTRTRPWDRWTAVTLIPTYFLFLKLGWVGTWLPLIVPAFFSWGTNVFLIRQFIMTIPRELDEAAMIDGANPLEIFIKVILPQSTPALTAVALFHFFYAWNDFFGPLIYLTGHPEKFPITVGLTAFNTLYAQSNNLIQAASLISSIIPVIVFFFAQRIFMQGVVITGVEK